MGGELPKLLSFRVVHSSGRTTHVGVDDFSAPDGVVGIPPKVAACLSPDTGVLADDAVLRVEIAELPRYKKTFVALRRWSRLPCG